MTSSADCKAAIVAQATAMDTQVFLAETFVVGEGDDWEAFVAEATTWMRQARLWKRIYKQTHLVLKTLPGLLPAPVEAVVKADGLASVVERCFDCTPFDDQLRATVWSTSERILHLEIQGE